MQEVIEAFAAAVQQAGSGDEEIELEGGTKYKVEGSTGMWGLT